MTSEHGEQVRDDHAGPGPRAADSAEAAPAPAPATEAEPDDAEWQAEPLLLPSKTRDRVMLIALASSILLHLLPLAPLVVALVLNNFDLASALDREREERLGDENGKLDGVNVEIIDAAEYDRKYMSHTDGKGAGNENTPQAAPAAAQPEQQQSKPEQAEPEKAEVEKTEPKAEPEKTEEALQPAPPPAKVERAEPTEAKPQPKPKPKPEAPTGITQAEAEQLIRTAQSEFQTYVEATSQASLAAQGSSSPAIREILRKLKRAMPRSKNERGFLIVRIMLTETGGVSSLALMKSSGSADLDNRVLTSVRNTLANDPSVRLKPAERSLQITYDYF